MVMSLGPLRLQGGAWQQYRAALAQLRFRCDFHGGKQVLPSRVKLLNLLLLSGLVGAVVSFSIRAGMRRSAARWVQRRRACRES